jgi:hypothetical protein
MARVYLFGPAVAESLHRQTSHIAQEASMAKYGKAAQKRVKSAMHRKKKGTLRSSSGAKVKSRKQAIAIGLSEARSKGAKVPRKRKAAKKR